MIEQNETFVGVISEERSVDYMHDSVNTLKIGFAIAGKVGEDPRKAIDDFVDAVGEFVENYNKNSNK